MSALPVTIDAVFEDGVFRPVTPVTFEPNQRVRITVNLLRVPREWPPDTAEVYRELAAEDRRIAAEMFGDVRATWPAVEDNR